ncbi:EamA family transporter RarD [Pseudochelatococcus sp. B33]
MSNPSISARPAPDALRGLTYALMAYLLWGLLPLYLKEVAHVPVGEVIAHRILWAVPFAGLLLLATDGTKAMRRAVRDPRVLGMAAVTATLISCNWGVYTWAVINDRALDTSLGYYINPLVSVLMGVVLLRERLDRPQVIAIGLATAAVLLLAVQAGGVPWVSLALPVTFAIYGYLRKTLPVAALQGFALEVLILSIPAGAYVAWLTATGGNHFGTVAADSLWLMAAGPVSAAPLVMFAVGARNLPLSTLGIMQYIAPTLVFLIAVFVFGEPFSLTQAVAFGLIWAGLAIFTWSGLAGHKRERPAE